MRPKWVAPSLQAPFQERQTNPWFRIHPANLEPMVGIEPTNHAFRKGLGTRDGTLGYTKGKHSVIPPQKEINAMDQHQWPYRHQKSPSERSKEMHENRNPLSSTHKFPDRLHLKGRDDDTHNQLPQQQTIASYVHGTAIRVLEPIRQTLDPLRGGWGRRCRPRCSPWCRIRRPSSDRIPVLPPHRITSNLSIG